jgi:hypothetical protein
MNLGCEFDKILVAGPLEFCECPYEVLQNLRRHIKRNGRIVLTVPNFSISGLAYMLYHLTHGFTIRLFTLNRITSLLNMTGFRVDVVEKPTSMILAISAIART